ncbi:MAG: hypothetical protein IKD77_00975 [Bacilli bacterium]|nr:hypothetical protein [Bacilli bacterium]
MTEVIDFNKTSKEVLTILAYCDESMVRKIPSKILKELVNCAADSTEDFFIDPSKDLLEQNISEKSKDLLAYIYYSYIADENEKKELINTWTSNEEKSQEELKRKYNTDNIFANKTISQNTTPEREDVKLIEYHKESFLKKIFNRVKAIFRR